MSLSQNHNDRATPSSEAILDSDARLRELGYAPQFKRDMSFLSVIGISFWYEIRLFTKLFRITYLAITAQCHGYIDR
jgi:hypothetical protein